MHSHQTLPAAAAGPARIVAPRFATPVRPRPRPEPARILPFVPRPTAGGAERVAAATAAALAGMQGPVAPKGFLTCLAAGPRAEPMLRALGAFALPDRILRLYRLPAGRHAAALDRVLAEAWIGDRVVMLASGDGPDGPDACALARAAAPAELWTLRLHGDAQVRVDRG